MVETQRPVLNQYKSDLDQLRVIMNSPHILSKKVEFEAYRKEFYNAFIGFVDRLDAGNRTLFRDLLNKFNNTGEQINNGDIESAKLFIGQLEHVELTQQETDKLNEIRNELVVNKSLLSLLQSQLPSPAISQEITELKQKVAEFKGLKENLFSFKSKHPIWTKAALGLLPQELREYLDTSSSIKAPERGGALGGLISLTNSITSVLSTLAGAFFLAFAPQALRDSLDQINKFWNALPTKFKTPDSLKYFIGGADISNIKNIISSSGALPDNKPTIPGQLDKVEQLNDLEGFKGNFKSQAINYIKVKLGKKHIEDSKISSAIDEFFAENDGDIKALGVSKLIESIKSNTGSSEYKFLSVFKDFAGGSFLMFKFIGKLIDRNLVSPTDIGVDTAKGVMEYGVVTLGILKDEMGLFSGEFKAEDLESRIDSLNLSDGEKTLVSYILYRKGGLFFNFLGSVSHGLSRLVLFPFFIGQDFSKWDAQDAALFGNIKKQGNIIESLERKIGTIGGSDLIKSNEYFRTLYESFGKLKNFYVFYDWFVANESAFKSSGKSLGEFLDTAPDRVKAISITLLDASTLGSKDIRLIRGAMAGSVEGLGTKISGGTSDLISRIGSKFQGALSEKYIYDNVGAELNRTASSLSNLIRNDEVFGYRQIKRLFVDKVRMGDSLSNLLGYSDDVVLRFSNPNDIKGFIAEFSAYARRFPDGAKLLFTKMPIIAVAGLSISKDDPSFSSVAQDIATLIPFVGPVMLINEGAFVKSQDGKLVMSGDAAKTMAGFALFGLDMYFVGKEISINGLKGLRNAMFRPLTDIFELTTGVFRGAGYTAKVAGDAARLVSKKGLFEAFRYGGEELKLALKAEALFPKLVSRGSLGGLAVGLALYFGYTPAMAAIHDMTDSPDKRALLGFIEKGDFTGFDAYLKSEFSKLSAEDKDALIGEIMKIKISEYGIKLDDNFYVRCFQDKTGAQSSFKITGYKSGANFINSERVDDNLLKVIKADFIERFAKLGINISSLEDIKFFEA